MGSGFRSNAYKKRIRYFLLFFSVAACIIGLALILGLKSYASVGSFNPDVRLDVLNSNGTVDTDPTFKASQTYHVQLSATLPTVQEVQNEGKDLAVGA